MAVTADLASDSAISNYKVDDQIGFLLRLAHQRASASLAAKINHIDLTPAQASVLARLHERGRVSQNLLGRLVAMESANIRDVVLRLKKRRLITQEKDPEDGRLIILRLTPAGQAMVEKLIPISIKSVSEILSPLNSRERDLLRSLLKRIIYADDEQSG